MRKKLPTLVLCLLALLPQQVCTCAQAGEDCHYDEGFVAGHDDTDCDGHEQHGCPAPSSHDHDPACLMAQPPQPTQIQKSTALQEVKDLVAVDSLVPLPLTQPDWVVDLSPFDAQALPPPHVPLFVTYCAFRK